MVEASGLVRTLALSGEAAIMARYQGNVAVFRGTVPLGVKVPDYKFEAKTVVDTFTNKKWKELGITPSDICSDEQFLRLGDRAAQIVFGVNNQQRSRHVRDVADR